MITTLQLWPCSAEKDATCFAPPIPFPAEVPRKGVPGRDFICHLASSGIPLCLCCTRAFDPGQGMPTEALQMLLMSHERLASFVFVYVLCHISYRKVKCGSHNHRGLQRGLWICWSGSNLYLRGHQGHRKLAEMVPSGEERVPPVMEWHHQKVPSSCFPTTSSWWSEFLQLLVIVCFYFICGFLVVESHCLLRGLAHWSSYFPKPPNLVYS